MIYVFEMDALHNVAWDDEDRDDIELEGDEELTHNGNGIAFYTKHIEAIPALYAYLWFDENITPGEKESLNSLYIDYNKRGKKKFFKRGKLNAEISHQELSASKQAIKDKLISALAQMGSQENIDLILYGFAHIHNAQWGTFAEALQKYGFNFFEQDFTCTDTAIYNEEGFGFFLLPNYQLEMIIPRSGVVKASLSNGPLYDNNIEPFMQRAIQQKNGADFKITVRSTFPKMREAWNNWIRGYID